MSKKKGIGKNPYVSFARIQSARLDDVKQQLRIRDRFIQLPATLAWWAWWGSKSGSWGAPQLDSRKER